MAQLDASIYNAFAPRVKSVQDYDNEAAQGQVNQLNLLRGRQEADQYTRKVEQENAFRTFQQGLTGTPEDQIGTKLIQGGFLTQGLDYNKSFQEGQKNKALTVKAEVETDKERVATRGLTLDQNIKAHEFHTRDLVNVTDLQGAVAWADRGLKAGIFGDPNDPSVQADVQGRVAKMQKMAEAPGGLEKWKQAAQQGGMSATEQLKLKLDQEKAAQTAQHQAGELAVSQGQLGVAQGQLGVARDRLTTEKNAPKGVVHETAEGVMLIDPRTGVAAPVTANGLPLKSKTSEKPTEDQSKAAGWLVQADNAWRNMQAAMVDDKGNRTGVEKPGLADVVASNYGGKAIGNSMRSAGRQKFVQAASSFSEAALRAATGAGVNQEEALQKIEELTPVWGEDPSTTEQKMAAMPLYLESLKVRAGGAGRAAMAAADTVRGGATPGASDIDSQLAAIRKKHGL